MKKPKRKYHISISIDAWTEKELWEAFNKCVATISYHHSCGKLGGQTYETEYESEYEENKDLTVEEYEAQRKEFAKFILNREK